MPRIYVAASYALLSTVTELYTSLRQRGHEITVPWAEMPNIKPFVSREVEAQERANLEIQGVLSADILILLTDETAAVSRGMFTELGVALAAQRLKQDIRIILLGRDNSSCVFYYATGLQKCRTVEELYNLL